MSLQLRDPGQDNSRVANWSTAETNSGPAWVYASATAAASGSRLYLYLQSAGDIYIDDIKIVAGSQPAFTVLSMNVVSANAASPSGAGSAMCEPGARETGASV